MTFLSQTTSTSPRAARHRISSLSDVCGALTFLLAVGFSAALVFGLIH